MGHVIPKGIPRLFPPPAHERIRRGRLPAGPDSSEPPTRGRTPPEGGGKTDAMREAFRKRNAKEKRTNGKAACEERKRRKDSKADKSS